MDGVSISWAPEWFSLASLLSPHLSPLIGLGHYDPLSSHEIDGVRKEKERLTAVSLFPAHFSQLLCGLSLRTLRTCLCLTALSFFHTPFSFSLLNIGSQFIQIPFTGLHNIPFSYQLFPSLSRECLSDNVSVFIRSVCKR